MANKKQPDSSAEERRRSLEEDLKAFLKAGNEIQYIEDGVSAQDPQGQGKQLRLSRPKSDAPAAPAAAGTAAADTATVAATEEETKKPAEK
ncbi:MAG: hypothetical protein GKR90_01035 [Pseudomonadales bacterium]|nr:hypothetical protein [Pseudomonadales bacterium]